MVVIGWRPRPRLAAAAAAAAASFLLARGTFDVTVDNLEFCRLVSVTILAFGNGDLKLILGGGSRRAFLDTSGSGGL